MGLGGVSSAFLEHIESPEICSVCCPVILGSLCCSDYLFDGLSENE